MTAQNSALEAWLDSPLGRRLTALETEAVGEVLEDVFGTQMLQIGRWGRADAFLARARTRRRTLLDVRPEAADLCAEPEHLAVATHSIDAVLLPHTLERSADPHQVLREADRALLADGRLIVVGFSPVGPLGVRRFLGRNPYPPGCRRKIVL